MLNYFWAVMIMIGVVYGALTGAIGAVGDAAFSSAGEAIELCFTMCGVMAFWVGLMKVAERAGIVAGLTKVIRPFVHFMFPDIPKGHKAEQSISMNIIANVLGLGWAATPAGLQAMKELAELETERGNLEYITDDISDGKMRHSDHKKDHVDAGHIKECQTARKGSLTKDHKGEPTTYTKEYQTARKGSLIKDYGGTMTARRKERTASKEMCDFLILNISSLQLIPVTMIAYRTQYGSEDPTAIIAPAIIATFISTVAAVIFCKIKK